MDHLSLSTRTQSVQRTNRAGTRPEQGRCPSDDRQLALRRVELKPEPQLEGTVECDEVYIVAGHKGHPEAVKKKDGPDDDAD